MTKLEKVIAQLEICAKGECSKDCPMYKVDDCYFINMRDALELLNERQWVSVKDRLPEKAVLALGFQNEMIIGYVCEDLNKGWIAENENELLFDVTHWMPLPEPPKEDESENGET